MIYLLYGSDERKARKKLHELLDIAGKKRPGAELFKLNSENWSEEQFDELMVSKGLFENKYTVVLDHLFERKEIKDYIVEKLDKVAKSEQIFLMLEGKVDSATTKKIGKYAKQVQEFVKVEKRKEDLNIFSITNGLINKDKKKLWISFVDLLRKGAGAEEIHGILFWQIKNMIIASRSKNISETGLSPFVYQNAISGSKKYNREELQKMANDLVEMTHKVRIGMGELDFMLEKWILASV